MAKIEKTIRDSVYGDITFDDDIYLKIIDTPEFQRLRRIAQLGGTQFAFPGATHTRFTHCIGVYHMVGKFLENPYFAEKTTAEEKTLVRLAGLLHDVGHGPFSHTFEKITKRSHEDYSRDIITNPKGNIAKIISKAGYEPKDVADIIEGTYPNEAINLIVSSQLDADRLDYLARDSLYCGVNYASNETDYLLSTLEIDDMNRIVFPEKTKYAIESYLLGRYHMFKQVYEHKLSTSFDVVLTSWFNRLEDMYNDGYRFKNPRFLYFFEDVFNGKMLPLDKYVELDDASMYDLFKLSELENDTILNDLASRLLNRQYFKVMPEKDANTNDIKAILEKGNYDENYYLKIIEPKEVTIYKDGIIDGKDETIYIRTDRGIVPFSKVSQLGDLKPEKNEKLVLYPKN